MKNTLLLSVFFLQTTVSFAQWSNNPSINNVICGDESSQHSQQIVSDGNGGAIIVWQDQRNGTTNSDIYAQKINSAGIIQWANNGVAICTAINSQTEPQITEDGLGGAIITWVDERSGTTNSNIYAQKINSAGITQWLSNGVAVCTATNNQVAPKITSNGANGATIVWTDFRTGNTYGNENIYTQRINANGATQWLSNGIAICSSPNAQYVTDVASTANGDVFITWEDFRNSIYSDIFVQKIDINGASQWLTNGVEVCNSTDGQNEPQIVLDNLGNTFLIWEDFRNGSLDIYTQKLNTLGVEQWLSNGQIICSATGNQRFPKAVFDGIDGIYITWDDIRNGSHTDIYAQRVNGTGSPMWALNGVAICSSSNLQINPKIIGSNNAAIIVWEDFRNGVHYDIYAQKINAMGINQWSTNGIVISSAPEHQANLCLISDAENGALIAWIDQRNKFLNNNLSDVFAQRINEFGNLCNNPNLSVNSGTLCVGSSFTIMANGAISYTYSGGTNVVTPTVGIATYSVVGTNTDGCINTVPAISSVTVFSLPNLSISSSNTLLCVSQTATLNANGASSYSWSTGTLGGSINVAPTVSTTYTVIGTDLNGCENNMSYLQQVSTCTGLSNNNTALAVNYSFFPNPFFSNFQFKATEKCQLIIYDCIGKIILDAFYTEGTHLIDLSNQNSALYIAKCISNNTVTTNVLQKNN